MVRKLIQRYDQRGDTLTEVMFATAVAGLAIILAMTAMNRSLAQSQMTVETTLARQSIEAEAEILRYIRDEYMEDREATSGPPTIWRSIINNQTKAVASTLGTCHNSDTAPPQDSFIVQFAKQPAPNDTKDDLSQLRLIGEAELLPAEVYPTLAEGMWVEAVRSPSDARVPYIDFHIRACWEPPYSGPDATLGTVVRLYYE